MWDRLEGIEEGFIQKRRQRSYVLFGGEEFIQFLATTANLQQDDLKNRMTLSSSLYHYGAIHPYLRVSPAHLILFFISSCDKIASAARN